ncbi:M23 family metallopeptidase [Corynebacterium qintianiae]|uniref:M23 family metallopeptidase n=1 Tax=Corynebacterium qintianiae TaxID=2709392 RepID=A0A7T0KLU3_9CORY|nr:M23 family metallopeptidase [Corynebacterium qintianiae]QPK82600.1 M23 family metallopeptidase [Corynebacterium qintianiae]
MRTLQTALFTAAITLTATAPATAYVDPTTGKPYATRITRSADIPEKDWLPGHRGVDLALDMGADVLAAADGTVAFAGVVAGTPVVSVDHADGIRTTYQPVYALVSTGDEVTEGTVIGRLAASREHDGLHWGARTGGDAYINPLTLLDTPSIRLKPMVGSG